MGTYCKTCDQRINEQQNEIIRNSGDLSQYNNNKRNNIKASFSSKSNNKNIDYYVPEIIFLQRKIKKYLSAKHESTQELFYNRNYSNNINAKNNEEFDIIGYNEEDYNNAKGGKNSSRKSDKFKTLSQK